MKFEGEVDDGLVDQIVPPIARQLADDPEKRKEFATFALRQIIGWMTGNTVYQSLTEQHTEWLTELLPMFFQDRPPSATQIFNSFSIPYGRAAYISRVLLEKQQTVWRQKGRDNLLAALGAKKREAQMNVDQGDGLKYVPVSLDSVAHRELSIVLDEMFEADPQLIPPISRTSSPGRYIVDLPSQHFAVIAEKLG